MTSQKILTGVCAGTVYGMIGCDVCIPEAFPAHFAEMQPVFKNIRLTRNNFGPFMRQNAEDHDIIEDTIKLLGNSGYGKTITNVDQHRDVVVDDAYEIEMNKITVTYALFVHVVFFVLQYAKMRMLQSYYDFINMERLYSVLRDGHR